MTSQFVPSNNSEGDPLREYHQRQHRAVPGHVESAIAAVATSIAPAAATAAGSRSSKSYQTSISRSATNSPTVRGVGTWLESAAEYGDKARGASTRGLKTAGTAGERSGTNIPSSTPVSLHESDGGHPVDVRPKPGTATVDGGSSDSAGDEGVQSSGMGGDGQVEGVLESAPSPPRDLQEGRRTAVLRIIDARPMMSAKGHLIMGKGHEVISRLGGSRQASLTFLEIPNIHAMQQGYSALVAACCAREDDPSWLLNLHVSIFVVVFATFGVFFVRDSNSSCAVGCVSVNSSE